MKPKKITTITAFLGSAAIACCLMEVPQADIKNEGITAKIYLPDAGQGYYRGTRFDWSGVVAALTYQGHSYFGQWFERYDPKLHDAITGPVEDFSPLGYETAKKGGTFVKIGIGVLVKDDTAAYQFQKPYPLVDAGRWKIEKSAHAIKFRHDLSNPFGYSYNYTKTLSLTPGKPAMVLAHKLRNTGNKTIETEVYDHNFFMLDKQPTGPAISIHFPFTINADGLGIGTLATFNGKQIRYLRLLKPDEHVYAGHITGFRPDPADYDIRIENQATGAGVRITSDRPLSRLVFWSSATTSCPEPYIHLKVLPGEEISWEIRYNFYTFTPSMTNQAEN